MITATVRDGLEAYAIGPKIRALRKARNLGLVELGRHTGLSPTMLSKIEREVMFPTLPTLLRVALVFGVGLEFFFVGPRDLPHVGVVRHRDRLRFADRLGGRDPAFHFESLDYTATERRFNAYIAEFPVAAGGKVRMHEHRGDEFVFVLKGTLVVRVDAVEYVLDTNDSMYFDAEVPHGYRRKGSHPCSAVVVTTR